MTIRFIWHLPCRIGLWCPPNNCNLPNTKNIVKRIFAVEQTANKKLSATRGLDNSAGQILHSHSMGSNLIPVESITPSLPEKVKFSSEQLAHRWKPGESGNPGGRPKTAKFRKGFLQLLEREREPGVTYLDAILLNQVELAISTQSRLAVNAAGFVRDSIGEKPVDEEAGAPQVIVQIGTIGDAAGWQQAIARAAAEEQE